VRKAHEVFMFHKKLALVQLSHLLIGNLWIYLPKLFIKRDLKLIDKESSIRGVCV